MNEQSKNLPAEFHDASGGKDSTIDGLETFTCFHCGRPYTSKFALPKHFKITHEPNRTLAAVCYDCGSTFTHKSGLFRHKCVKQLVFGDVNKLFDCFDCRKAFDTKYLLEKHARTHLGLKPVACFECIYSAFDKPSMARHIFNVHLGVSVGKRNICDLCSMEFCTGSAMWAHKRFVHQKLRPHACPDCPLRCMSQIDLNRHRDTVHFAYRAFSCAECSAAFTAKAALTRHILNHVSCESQRFVCFDCGKEHSGKFILAGHMQHKHSDEPPPTVCCFDCGSARYLWRKASLVQHGCIRRRISHSTFLCYTCGRKFDGKKNVETHVQIHLDIMICKPFACFSCCYTGRSQKHVTGHIYNVHFGKYEHICDKCSKAFRSRSAVQLHKRGVHLKIRPFACPDCQLGCRSNIDLSRHRNNVHFKEEIYRCAACTRGFIRKASLTAHTATCA